MTTSQDFTLANNENWEFLFVIDVGGDAGNVITGSKVHMAVRPSADSPIISLEASVDNGRLIVEDAPAGHVQLIVFASTMRKLVAGAYVYDLIVERPTGRVYRPFAGVLTLLQGVTELQVTPPVT